MHRFLGTTLFAYVGLSAAQWGHAKRWLNAPPGVPWCGNAVTDPFSWLVNVVGPLAAACAIILLRRCVKACRWPSYAVTALLAFVATTGGLVYEARLLSRYGLEIGVWWLSWV